ncbi:iron ABC transporter permease [Lachnospiraceae bacterium ZAX-1]
MSRRSKSKAKQGDKHLPPFSSFLTRGRVNHFQIGRYVFLTATMLLIMLLCVSIGSVNIAPKDTLSVIWKAICGLPLPENTAQYIILSTRLPRVVCVALVGASLSLCGGVMQGLLKNPLADGTTLGVSSGAALGAAIAIAFGITIPQIPFAGTMGMAMLFAFISIVMILSLAYRMDNSLSTNTIILIGVIYSMFVSSIMSLVITFAADKVRNITFWTMGSLGGSNYTNALVLLVALVGCSVVIFHYIQELNAFAIGEENARHIGVNVKKVKLILLIAVSALIGICVSIGGSIGFVGLVMPHMTRMVVGPNHKRLLPASLLSGASFLMLADLVARILLNPLELPIGVVTSFIGSIAFVYIFYRSRRVK